MVSSSQEIEPTTNRINVDSCAKTIKVRSTTACLCLNSLR